MNARQRRQLMTRLEAREQRRERYTSEQIELISLLYERALLELTGDINEQLGEASVDDAGYLEAEVQAVAQVRRRLVQDELALRRLWTRWGVALTGLERMADSLIRVDGSEIAIGEAERVLIRELRGLWPTKGSAGTGMAGRFYNLSQYHRQQLANTVTQGVLGQERRSVLVRRLRDSTGRDAGQAEQLFHDSTTQFSRSVTRTKAQSAGYEHYQYLGPHDRITRPFCDRIIRGIYTEAEIRRMDNGQTGAGTAFEAGGGYRCRHHWRPVRRDWFENDEWEELRGNPAEDFSDLNEKGRPIAA